MIGIADIEQQLVSGTVPGLAVERYVAHRLGEPSAVRDRQRIVPEQRKDGIGRTGARLQAPLGEFAGAVAHAIAAGRQLQSPGHPVSIGGMLPLDLIPPRQHRVARLREVPGFEQLRAAMIVNMLMLAVYQRQSRGKPPALVEIVVEPEDRIAIDRLHLVVMLRDLPDGDIPIAGARLVLVDIFEIDVDAGAGSARRKLRDPVRVDVAESGAATGESGRGQASPPRAPRAALAHKKQTFRFPWGRRRTAAPLPCEKRRREARQRGCAAGSSSPVRSDGPQVWVGGSRARAAPCGRAATKSGPDAAKATAEQKNPTGAAAIGAGRSGPALP